MKNKVMDEPVPKINEQTRKAANKVVPSRPKMTGKRIKANGAMEIKQWTRPPQTRTTSRSRLRMERTIYETRVRRICWGSKKSNSKSERRNRSWIYLPDRRQTTRTPDIQWKVDTDEILMKKDQILRAQAAVSMDAEYR